jgi:para-aminobenzoate synthetase component 1
MNTVISKRRIDISEAPGAFKSKMLNWLQSFNIFCFLDSHGYRDQHSQYDWIAAVDAMHVIELSSKNSFGELKQFADAHPGWLFGHMNYPDDRPDCIGFPPGFFFQPKIMLTCKGDEVEVCSSGLDSNTILRQIDETVASDRTSFHPANRITPQISRTNYLKAIELIKEHLQRGDCYEMNYCQEFQLGEVELQPLQFYLMLMSISPNPFSAWYRLNDRYCFCASPERFLQKKGDRLLSQPIKGTARRHPDNADKDKQAATTLMQSKKEIRENVMIVDLVRNDMSRVAARGTVHVPELMQLHSFPQVFQLISSVEARLDLNCHWSEALDVCFPMGSMTGAPKKRVMELTKNYEATPRGLFSGTIGYIDPERDFDFNVVIRSAFYNASTSSLSIKAGGGITIQSNPEEEYQESLLKIEALLRLFTINLKQAD